MMLIIGSGTKQSDSHKAPRYSALLSNYGQAAILLDPVMLNYHFPSTSLKYLLMGYILYRHINYTNIACCFIPQILGISTFPSGKKLSLNL